jgi:hypothetical protein
MLAGRTGEYKGMQRMPTNAEIAAVIKISESDVARYRRASSRQVDGSWVISFHYDMPQHLRRNLTGSFTIAIHGTGVS